MAAETPFRARLGRWLLRWTIRLLLLAGVYWVLLLPYDHEVVGRCRLIPMAQYGVRARVDGEVLSVDVMEGQWVEPGTLVAVLDDREYRKGLETSGADLKRLQAEYDLLVAGPREEQLVIARETLELWQVRLDHYESELLRVTELAEKNAGSTKDVEQAELSRDSAIHLVASATESLAKLEEGAREEEIRAKEAEVEHVQANFDFYSRAIDLTRITSPIAGRVITPFMLEHIGQVVRAGELLAVIHDTTALVVEVAAEESAGALVEPEMDAKFRLDGLDGRLLTGKVLAVGLATSSEAEFDIDPIRSDRESQLESSSGRADDRTRVRLFCRLDDSDERLLPGMTGYARIEIGTSLLWRELWRPIERFLYTDVWSWLP